MAQGFPVPDRQIPAARVLDRLAESPPQTLLLEGGSAGERAALALYWAARLNCQEPSAPCGLCQTCVQIQERVLRDLHFLESAEDQFKIESLRAIRPDWGQPPRGAGVRVTVFAEAQDLRPESANFLLKTLEEPRPGNVFVLLAPLRERLLETLVSRSWVITLAWPEIGQDDHQADGQTDDQAAGWVAALVEFWRTGRGWFERTSTRGAVDRALALAVLGELSRELARAMAGRPVPGPSQTLAQLFDAPGLARLDRVLAQALEALTIDATAHAAPALVLDWTATRMKRP